MQKRRFGKTGWMVTEVGFGSWNIGGAWGDVSDETGYEALRTVLDSGINFIDTADGYGAGRSERHIAKILNEVKPEERIYVGTKIGRFPELHPTDAYPLENMTTWIDLCRSNLQVDTIDLVQLHCPPNDVYYNPAVFEALEKLTEQGKIRHYGVSVEKVEQGLMAMEYPNLVSVQIIFNMFRHRPYELFFEQAKQKDVAVIARVPLASGLLTGKITADTTFAENDHRNFNRHGESFDQGETFSGVPFDKALEAVEAIRELVPESVSMAQWALRWILMFDAITVVIPGSTNPKNIRANVAAADLPPISDEDMRAIKDIYDFYVKKSVHTRW